MTTEIDAEGLARFGHHPDPAIDFELEVQDLEAEVYNFIVGFQPLPREKLDQRIDLALDFRVGAVPSCVHAKDVLRRLARRFLSYDPSATTHTSEAEPVARDPITAADLWEMLFSITKDNVPDEMTDDLLARLATELNIWATLPTPASDDQVEAVAFDSRSEAAYFGSIWCLTNYQMAELEKTFTRLAAMGSTKR